jgi:hypothetical protein
MTAIRKVITGLMAGLAAGSVQAHQTEARPLPTATDGTALPKPGVQLRTSDGRPLPPELARQVEEALKADGAADENAAAPKLRILGPDGKPLPPEIAEQLGKQFNDQLSQTAAATDATTDAPSPGEERIVVTSERPRGSVPTDIPPERTFGALDIGAFGAENLAALLDTVSSQTASNRGRSDGAPVTLLNGRRVSSFAEIARIPTEAIERMEIFPEEVALQYGYRADQKVVNIVTFPRYQSTVGQATTLVTSEGGRETGIGSGDYLRLAGDTRMGLGATYSRAANLLESERNVRQFAGAPELGRFRTLLPDNERLGVNGVLSGIVLEDVAASVNARVDVSRNTSLLGLEGVRPLRRDSDQTALQLGTTLSGSSGRWQWTALGNIQRTETDVLTDVAVTSSRRDTASSAETLVNADLIASGPLATLPAGPLTVSLRLGGELRDFTSRASIAESISRADLSRDRGGAQIDLSVPLFGGSDAASAPPGRLAVSASAAYETLSDAGSLRTYGYGLQWSPIKGLDLLASATHEQGAPTLEQLGGPVLVTPNVRTFDFARREVIDLTRISGGNPALRNDERDIIRVGLNLRPLAKTDLTLSMDYVRTRIDDPIAPFPVLTTRLEAAFPDSFARDPDGRLTRIDARPVNFASSRQQQLRWGIDFTRPLGDVPEFLRDAKVKVVVSDAEARRLFPGATMMRPEPGSATAQGIATLASRFYVSLYHNWYLEDSITLSADGPTLDLLGGDAVDFLGGRRRHEVELQAGAYKRGLGARLTATWRSGTTIDTPGSAAGDLRFDDIAVFNLNLFVNVADRFGGADAPRWMKGLRASLGVNNVLNTRPKVRDDDGSAPLSYQPAYLDPLGRTFSLSLRKAF